MGNEQTEVDGLRLLYIQLRSVLSRIMRKIVVPSGPVKIYAQIYLQAPAE